MSDVNKLVQQGLGLKRAGKIARFKVRNRGPNAISVLEIRKWTENQQRGSWQVRYMLKKMAVKEVWRRWLRSAQDTVQTNRSLSSD
jgi:hypothetical protein